MNDAQRILLLVWAGLFGALAGEVLTPTTLLGSSLIVAGVLVSEVGRSTDPIPT